MSIKMQKKNLDSTGWGHFSDSFLWKQQWITEFLEKQVLHLSPECQSVSQDLFFCKLVGFRGVAGGEWEGIGVAAPAVESKERQNAQESKYFKEKELIFSADFIFLKQIKGISINVIFLSS